ncbi:hypothetical protein HDU98_001590 [Podochytrium sp. JEL0797]|nr:hypothetical protein HDU98_001590 [Podochytrium sp. JEL0797]
MRIQMWTTSVCILVMLEGISVYASPAAQTTHLVDKNGKLGPEIIESNGRPIAVAFPDDPHPGNVKPAVVPPTLSSTGQHSLSTSTAIPSIALAIQTSVSSSVTQTIMNSTNATNSDSNSADSSTEANDALVKAHGALMFLAWCVFAPAGVISARYYKHTEGGVQKWFPAHVAFFLACFIATVISFALIYEETGSDHFDVVHNGPHVGIGLAVFILIFFQVTMGFLSHHFYQPSRVITPWWDKAHHGLGRVLGLAALINIPLGISLYQSDLESSGAGLSPWVWVSFVVWLLCLVAGIAFLEGRRRPVAVARGGGGGGAGVVEFHTVERGMSDSTLLSVESGAPLPKKLEAQGAGRIDPPSEIPMPLALPSRVVSLPEHGIHRMDSAMSSGTVNGDEAAQVLNVRYLSLPEVSPEVTRGVLSPLGMCEATEMVEMAECLKSDSELEKTSLLKELRREYKNLLSVRRGVSWAGVPNCGGIAEASEEGIGFRASMSRLEGAMSYGSEEARVKLASKDEHLSMRASFAGDNMDIHAIVMEAIEKILAQAEDGVDGCNIVETPVLHEALKRNSSEQVASLLEQYGLVMSRTASETVHSITLRQREPRDE